MQFHRNHYLLAGLVVFLLGLQFRAVESFTLNRECSHFIATRFPKKSQNGLPPSATLTSLSVDHGSPSLRTIKPPRWLGYAMLSVGAVFILHSLVMKKQGG
jgi:hypothetical protein